MWKYISRNIRETFERRICSSLTDRSTPEGNPFKCEENNIRTITAFCELFGVNSHRQKECKWIKYYRNQSITEFCGQINRLRHYEHDSCKRKNRQGESGSWGRETHIGESWLGALGWSTALVFSWNLIQPLCRVHFSCDNDNKSHGGTRPAHFLCWKIKKLHSHPFENCASWHGTSYFDQADGVCHSQSTPPNFCVETVIQPKTKAQESIYVSAWDLVSQTVLAQPLNIIPNKANFETNEAKPPVEERGNYGPVTANEALQEAGNNFAHVHRAVAAGLANQRGVILMENGNHHEAVACFTNAFKYNNSSAAFNLGVCHEMGLGTNQDFTKAALYYQLAAEQGHATAMYNLGVFHIHGWGGVPVDSDQTQLLFERASLLGQPDAKRALEMVQTTVLPPEVPGAVKETGESDLVQQALDLVKSFQQRFPKDSQYLSANIDVPSTDHKDISDLVHDSIIKYTAMLQK